ncbi:MAG: hypothetical protein VR73_08200 [Gammaproteobacteria bacterium BRH_c0]|nr:MAG: hypothetical protein VR73_08200 [Gammaproteobacteria bacterium BRH_c0]
MPISKKNKSPQQFSEERVDVLLSVALQEFLALGFRACSLDHISRQSRVSKVTIYRHFANKEALFEAVAIQVTDEIAAAVATITLDPEAPADSLRALGRQLHGLFVKPRYTEIMRMLIAESPHMPDISLRLRDRMLAEIQGRLTAFFSDLIARGAMEHPDPAHASAIFGVLAGGAFRGLFGARGSRAKELARLEADMAMFIGGCGIS